MLAGLNTNNRSQFHLKVEKLCQCRKCSITSHVLTLSRAESAQARLPRLTARLVRQPVPGSGPSQETSPLARWAGVTREQQTRHRQLALSTQISRITINTNQQSHSPRQSGEQPTNRFALGALLSFTILLEECIIWFCKQTVMTMHGLHRIIPGAFKKSEK